MAGFDLLRVVVSDHHRLIIQHVDVVISEPNDRRRSNRRIRPIHCRLDSARDIERTLNHEADEDRPRRRVSDVEIAIEVNKVRGVTLLQVPDFELQKDSKWARAESRKRSSNQSQSRRVSDAVASGVCRSVYSHQ